MGEAGIRPRVAYLFGGAMNLTPVRELVKRLDAKNAMRAYRAWEESPHTTAVRAFASPGGDSTLVGLLLVSFQRRHLRIERVLVDPDWRRQRVATNMFFRMVMDPRAQQFASVTASCPDNNDPAIAWLRHCKFKAISVLPASEPNRRDHYLFTWSFDNMSSGGSDEGCLDADSVRCDSVKPCPFTAH